MKTLRVKPVGTAMVQDFEALDGGVKRFIGRRLDVAAGGFVPVDVVQEIPFRAEYMQAVRDGDLECADAESAALCGVRFIAKPQK